MEKKLRRIEIRRGLSSQRGKVLYEEGEPVYLVDKKRVYIGDNKTFGGILASNINIIDNNVKRDLPNSIPSRAVFSDVIIDRFDNSGYMLHDNNQLLEIFSNPDCCAEIRTDIDYINSQLDKLYNEFCNTSDAIITDDSKPILADYGDYLKIDIKVEKPQEPPKPPVVDYDISGRKLVGVGTFHTLAIRKDGTLWAWGKNDFGQLGDGTNVDKNDPLQIGTDNNWFHVVAGLYYSLGIKTDGTLWGWGDNKAGQLGDGTKNNKNVPTQIGKDADWKIVDIGKCDVHNNINALKKDGSYWNWGHPACINFGSDSVVPKKNDYLDDILSISNGKHEVGILDKYGVITLCENKTKFNNSWTSLVVQENKFYSIKSDGTLYYNGITRISDDKNWVRLYGGILGTFGVKIDGSTWFIKKDEQIKILDAGWEQIDFNKTESYGVKKDGTIWRWKSKTSVFDITKLGEYESVQIL